MNQPLHIAYLTPEFVTEPKFDGGLANYLNRVTRALADAGHKPEVFVLSDRNETIDHNGVPVHRVLHRQTCHWRLAYRALKKLARTDLKMTSEVLRASAVLARRLSLRQGEEQFHLVQGSDFYATGLRVPPRRKVPLVTRLSYYAPACREASGSPLTGDRQIVEWLQARALRRSDFRYAPSSAVAALVERELAVDVDVLPPPAFLDTPRALEDDSVHRQHLAGKEYVLFFGRVCRLKGAYMLTDAMRRIALRHSSLWLVIAGREDPPGIVDELRRQSGTGADRLVHLPRLPHPQLFPIIRGARVIALPSRIDNFPNTCVEAMGLGKIVIATRNAGFDDLITDGRDGFLVPTDDAGALAETISRALSLPDAVLANMSRNAAARLAEFSPERMIPELAAYYRACIASMGRVERTRWRYAGPRCDASLRPTPGGRTCQ